MTKINENNYELWLLRYAEGELTADECREVEAWLAEHPNTADELRLYNEAPRLQRDEGVHYVAQQHTRPLWANGWRWVAAAAVLLLLLTPVTLSLFHGTDKPVQVAHATLPEGTSTVADSVVVAKATTSQGKDETVSPAVWKAPVKAATTRPQTTDPEPMIAIADEAMESTEKPENNEVIETPEIIQMEQPSTLVYVDNLIVFEEEPEPSAEYVTINEVTYTNTETSINPIGHFISTFIKANK